MEFCQNFYMVAYKRDAGIMQMTRLRCGMWSCPFCAKANQRMWKTFLLGQLPLVSENWWLLTLTAHSKKRQQQASYANLSRGINLLMKRIRRVFGKIDYVRVFEKHPTSVALHAHIIISNLSPFLAISDNRNNTHTFTPLQARDRHKNIWTVRTWAKRLAHACKIGYEVDCQRIESAFAFVYVTKYLTKASQDIKIKNMRHVQTSRRIGSPDSAATGSWQVVPRIFRGMVRPGETIHDIQTGEKIPYEYFKEFELYP